MNYLIGVGLIMASQIVTAIYFYKYGYFVAMRKVKNASEVHIDLRKAPID